MKNGSLLAAVVKPNTTSNSVSDLISGVIDYVLLFIGGVLMLMIIWGGVQYITSGGDPEKTGKAKKTLMWAILAVILIVISYSVVVALNEVVNTKILN